MDTGMDHSHQLRHVIPDEEYNGIMGEKNYSMDRPLNMPIGSVRAILAILLVLAFICPAIDNENIKDATLLVLGFYFGSRPID